MEDGIRPMAKHFTLSVKQTQDIELENFMYELFYGVLQDTFKELKKIKLN